MLISTPEELRLYSPANAIDHIESLQGFIDSSEQDFLLEKLGTKLYKSLVEYYRQLRTNDDVVLGYVGQIATGEELTPYARLLSLAQRVLTFDALGRAIDMQAISVNGAGVNMATASDYVKTDNEAIKSYKATCTKEAHAAINALLVTLEDWTKEVAETTSSDQSDGSDQSDESDNSDAEEKKEITQLWQSSRYYYLAAGLAIPSATVLQEYLDIYSSREKFITMLPDLRYIQEDIIAPVIGEDFLDYLIAQSRTLTDDGTSATRLLLRTIHKLRKAVARHLEARTQAIRLTDPRRETAKSEAGRLTTDLSEYITTHQSDYPEGALTALKSSPLYVADEAESNDYTPEFENNADDAVIFTTPALFY